MNESSRNLGAGGAEAVGLILRYRREGGLDREIEWEAVYSEFGYCSLVNSSGNGTLSAIVL